MTANALIKKLQNLVSQLSTGDVPIYLDGADVELVTQLCSRQNGSFYINMYSVKSEPKGYDPDYLQPLIDKATKSWEGVDVDEFMDEIRGREPANRDQVGTKSGPSLKQVSEIPTNLEEAAKEYVRQYNESEFGNGGDDWDDDIFITFKAGAEWQKKQDQETIELAEEHALLAGRMQMKEEMMKWAISCKVFWHDGRPLLDYTQEQQDAALERIGADVDDRVKLIILKDDESSKD